MELGNPSPAPDLSEGNFARADTVRPQLSSSSSTALLDDDEKAPSGKLQQTLLGNNERK